MQQCLSLLHYTFSHQEHPWNRLATIYSQRRRELPKAMALPPTPVNLLQHILWAHLKVMLWKAANCEASPDESRGITNFGWEF